MRYVLLHCPPGQRPATARRRSSSLWLPLLLFLTVAWASVVQAQSCDGWQSSRLYNYNVENGTVTIVCYTGSESNVTIPGRISGLPVKAIGKYAFLNKRTVTSVTIPNSVTSIGTAAFVGCTNLTSVTIGNSVTSIGGGAFGRCTKLTGITVDSGNASYASLDGVLFSKGMSELVGYPAGKSGTYTIPNSVTSIGTAAFYGSTSLTGVTIPDSVTSIGGGAFRECTSLTGVTIPNSVTSIANDPFYGCTKLTGITVDSGNASYASLDGVLFSEGVSVLIVYPAGKLGAYTIPGSVTSIGSYAFRECTSLTSLMIPNSVTSIGNGAFSGCTGLTSLAIANGVTSIGEQAFWGCTRLTSMTIPGSVTVIGRSAFSGCTSLTSVTIPNSVTSIGSGAFAHCTGLSRVYFSGNAPNGTASFQYTQATVYYLQGTTGWSTWFGGRPTVRWSPRIVTKDGQLAVSSGHFIFTLAGVSGGSVVVEACDQLGQPNWLPVSTNTFNADGLAQFTDPSPADRPSRMYRLTVP